MKSEACLHLRPRSAREAPPSERRKLQFEREPHGFSDFFQQCCWHLPTLSLEIRPAQRRQTLHVGVGFFAEARQLAQAHFVGTAAEFRGHRHTQRQGTRRIVIETGNNHKPADFALVAQINFPNLTRLSRKYAVGLAPPFVD